MHGGGCERWHIDVLNRFKNTYQHQVRLITGDFGGNDLPKSEVKKRLNGIDYQIIKTKKVWGGIARVPNEEGRKIIEEAVKEADAVHFIFGFFGQDSMMKRLKRKYGTKIVAGIHAPLFYENKSHNLYVALYSRFFTMPKFDGFMALNPGEYKILKKWNLPNAHFIPSGVDVNKFVAKSELRKKDTLTFLFAGRYEMQKAPDIAAKAITKFIEKTGAKDVLFNFIGSGSMEKYISEIAEIYPNQVKNIGYSTQPVPFFQACNLFFLPSRQEPFGLVVVEAMATGAPVLASKSEGPTLMVTEGKTGYFFEELTSSSVAKTLTKVYELWKKDSKVFERMKNAMRKQAEKYSIDASVEKMNKRFFT